MKCTLLTLLLIASATLTMFAQEVPTQNTDKGSGFRCDFTGPVTNEEREKLPYFGNNDYLMDVLREKAGIDIGANYQKEVEKKGYIPFDINAFEKIEPDSTKQAGGITTQASGIDYDVVPVTVWVYRRNDGSGGTVNQADAEAFFDEVQRIYEPTGIKVYMLCAINFINSTQFYTLDRAEYVPMITTNRVAGTLNVHLVNEMNFADGTSSPPSSPANERYSCAVGISNNPVIGREGNVISHEIGHTLGLIHTHSFRDDGDPFVQSNGDCNKCHQESVSRSKKQGLFCYRTGDKKCEVNGDMLCDTPADPLLIPNSVDNACNINRAILTPDDDRWGDAWQSNTRNVMAYGNFACLTTFSASQVAIMYSNLSPIWSNSTTLNAPTSLCSGQTGNFYAPYSPASYRWVVPAGWTLVSGQGTRHATIRAGNNSGTVYAYPSCGNPRLDHYVSVTPSSLTINGPSTLCRNEYATYTATYIAGATYTWTVNGMSLTSGQGTRSISVATGSNFSGGYISVSMTKGSCSGSGSKYVSQGYNCGYLSAQDSTASDSLKIEEVTILPEKDEQNKTKPAVEVAYPNPSDKELNINMATWDEYTVQLLDEQGKEVFQGVFIADKVTLPVDQYPHGLYYVKVYYQGESVVKRVYIKK